MSESDVTMSDSTVYSIQICESDKQYLIDLLQHQLDLFEMNLAPRYNELALRQEELFQNDTYRETLVHKINILEDKVHQTERILRIIAKAVIKCEK